jgi:predicted MFS family arabinose efflux permease
LIKAESWGWGSGKTIAGFAIAAVLIAAFVAIEHRLRDPLVPLRIFSNRSLTASLVTFVLVAAALFGMFYFLTLYLQQVLGYGALKTGVSYLPLTLILIAASAGAARLVDRFTPKPVLVTGLLITTGGFILLSQVSGHGDYLSRVLPAMVILGLGVGMSFVPVTIAATGGVAPEDSGLASGLLNATQQVGGSLGLAILSTVSTTRVANALHGGAALPVALTHGFKGGFTVAGLLCAAGAVLALVLLPRRKRAVDNEQVETSAMSFARCPGAPNCGHLARVVAIARRINRRHTVRRGRSS